MNKAVAVVLLTVSLAGPAIAVAAIPWIKSEKATLAPMLEKILPGVVNISIQARVQVRNPFSNDPFFRRFFEPREREVQSSGSGVIVDAAKGYILTNNHVIRHADRIVVTLRDGREFQAEVVGSDPAVDLAVIKIKPDGLIQVPFADSAKLRVGDFVVAIGNPFGLGQTVTSGIVSALGRSGLGIEGVEDFIQTDASINPGNSGGALVNLEGRLIGINTAIIGPNQGNVGIGFAIPSNLAKDIMQQLLQYGEVRRGQLGVLVQDLTPKLARAFGIRARKGVVITRVVKGLSADKSGLKSGDVVVAVDGKRVANADQLRNAFGLRKIGDVVEMDIIRNGQRRTMELTISGADPSEQVGSRLRRLDGATFNTMDPNHPLYGYVEGIQVVSVEIGSPAWQSGLRADDIIVAINKTRTTSLRDMRRALKSAHEGLSIHIQRGRIKTTVFIR